MCECACCYPVNYKLIEDGAKKKNNKNREIFLAFRENNKRMFMYIWLSVWLTLTWGCSLDLLKREA